ncbi:MAG: helix-turn-helix domain-containing protein [Alphaproteobacteria bacterium]|nr:helix-turn-helix domain-containing protein [Alphaproteobacteria bacterium]
MGAKPERVDESFESEAFSQEETTTAAPLDIGSLLKQERIKQNKKIPAISRELRISEHYILALEDGNIAALPERVYTLGFVRTYALYLGLDASFVVDRFKKESLGLESSSKTYVLPEAYLPQKGPSRRVLRLSFLFGLLLIGGWLFYQFQSSKEMDGVGENEIETPPVMAAPTPQDSALQTEIASTQTAVAEKEHPDYSQEAEDFALGLLQSPEPGVNVVPPQTDLPSTPVPEKRPETPQQPQIPQEPTSIPQEPVTQTAPSDAVQTLSEKPNLVFTEPSWIQVLDANGHVHMEKLFKPGERYVIPQGARFAMRVGNGGGVFIAKGDKKSSPLGQKGQVLSHVLLDQKSVEEYLNRQ